MNYNHEFSSIAHPYEVVLVDVNNPVHVDLLRKAYENVYKTGFKNPNELDPLDKWLTRLAEDSTSSRYAYYIFITGSDLNDTDLMKPNGLSVGIYYNRIDSALLAYNVVSEDARGMGIGKHMVKLRTDAFHAHAESRGKELKAIFLEVVDPTLVSSDESCIDPELRQNMFKKWGGHIIPFTYIQPALSPELEAFHSENLMFYPLKSGRVPSYQDVAEYLKQAFYYSIDSKEYHMTKDSLLSLANKQGYCAHTVATLPDLPIVTIDENGQSKLTKASSDYLREFTCACQRENGETEEDVFNRMGLPLWTRLQYGTALSFPPTS